MADKEKQMELQQKERSDKEQHETERSEKELQYGRQEEGDGATAGREK